MNKQITSFLFGAALLLSLTTHAQFTKLLDLYDAGNGARPIGGVVSDGTYLYGTTQGGGLYNKGTIYKIKPDGTGYVRLFNFDGTLLTAQNPINTLYYDGTSLYGVTNSGGANNLGIAYKINTDGTGFSPLLDFYTNFGRNPYCQLISDGTWVYGTSEFGGSTGYGTIFKIRIDGTPSASAFYTFAGGANGGFPSGSPVTDGTYLYGTTEFGGTNSLGTIYKIKPDGTSFSTLMSFSTSTGGNGTTYGALVYDGTYLYGVNNTNGANNLGTIYKIKTDGTDFTKLHDFTTATGGSPTHSLKLIGNTLYGMASAGGANNKGVIYKINTDGSAYTDLYDFAGVPDGATPANEFYYDGTFLYAPVNYGGNSNNGELIKIKTDGTGYAQVLDFSGISGAFPQSNGSFIYDGTYMYAHTANGGGGTCSDGCGTLLKIKPDGSYGNIHNFSTVTTEGVNPYGSLYSDGTYLYGTTLNGGLNGNGIVYKVLPDGIGFTKIHDFQSGAGIGGIDPYGALVSDGTFLYGTARLGGANGLGTIYKLMPDGTGFSVLLNFAGTANGKYPQSTLIYDGTYLYGTTTDGGSGNNGTVFKILPDGTGYATLINFNGANGTFPASLLSDGTWLYGTTQGGGTDGFGTVYKIKPDGTGFITLHTFLNSTELHPHSDLIKVGSWLYGTTYDGGQYNKGTIYRLKTDGTGYEKLVDFDGAQNGEYPEGGLISIGNYLYGMTTKGGTAGDGTVYRLCPQVSFSQVLTICPGESVTVGSSTYNVTGVYTDVLTGVNTCDSVVTTNLTVRTANTFSQSPVLCAGESITVGTNTYSTSGTRTDVLTSVVTGCDSTITTNLTVLPANTFSQSPVLCAGESIIVGTNTYSTTGSHTDVLTSLVTGCDSTVTTNLTVLPANTFSQTLTICQGESVTVGSNTYTTTNVYTDVLTSLLTGCDSTVTTDLTVDVCIGIENMEDAEFSIYPNPGNGLFTITNSQTDSYLIELHNSIGQLLFTKQVNEQTTVIDIQIYASGVYFITLSDEEKMMRSKLIKN